MNREAEIKASLREWIARKGKVSPGEITDETPFLEQRIISSVQLMELILFLEDLRKDPIDVKGLKRGMLRDINTIYTNFFAAK